jgi:hypothetical protein
MTPPLHSESADLEQSERVGSVVAALRTFLKGAVDPPGLARFARELWPEAMAQSMPFHRNGLANTAWISILNATDPELRISDVECYLRWLTRGAAQFPVRVCGVRANAAQIALQLNLITERYIVDGLGWIESVEFTSLCTDRQFRAESSMTHGVPDNVYVRASESVREPQPVLDLCNTLGIDAADCFLEQPEPARWRLWRQDDNGHRAVVASFTALRKARSTLAELEASAHKQMYWLEPEPAGDAG